MSAAPRARRGDIDMAQDSGKKEPPQGSSQPPPRRSPPAGSRFKGTLMGFRRPEEPEKSEEEPADTVLWGGDAKRRTTVKMTREEVFGVDAPPPPAGAGKTVPQGSPEGAGPSTPAGPSRAPLASNPALTGGTSHPGPNRHRSYPDVESYPPAPAPSPYAAAIPPPVPQHLTPPHDTPAPGLPEARGTVPIGPDAPGPGEEPAMDLGSTLIMDESAEEPAPAAPVDPDSSAALQAIAFNAGRLNLPAARRYEGTGSKVEPAPPVKMNKWSYRLVIFGCLLVAALIFAATYEAAKTDASLAVGFAWIPFVPAAMMHFVMIHRMWQGIQDSQARMTPNRAVGFMFVPLFNLYWVFEVFPGFATDFNAYVQRHGLHTPRLSRGLLIAMLLVPGLNIVLYWMAIGQICDGVSQLSEP